MRPKVPFVDLAAQQAEISAVVLPVWRDILESASFIGGAVVNTFEALYADYIGVNHCIGVGNGTDAVELALRATGVEPGDEVIIPVNTFIASAEAVSRIGATPVFVDVDDDHLLIDPAAVADAVTGRTRAIMPVHLYGQTAPVEALAKIAEKHGLAIVEDAAQSQGASSVAGRAGTLGTVAATSFYPGKNLGAAGDAGAVLTDDPEIDRVVRSLAAHGSSLKYVHDRVGFNSRLDAVQASVLSAKLRRLDDWNDARRRAATRYAELLSDVHEVRVPKARDGNKDVWHLYVIRVDDRDRLLECLAEADIGAAIHYPTPLHRTAAYGHLGYAEGEFPVAEAAAARILSLPMFPHLSADQQVYVADTVRALVGHG